MDLFDEKNIVKSATSPLLIFEASIEVPENKILIIEKDVKPNKPILI